MDIVQLKYFETCANLENITKAAEQLNMVQPALSQSIRRLELELGVDLFDRLGRSVRLNNNGRILLKYTGQILSLLDSAKEELQEHVRQEKGTIRIKILCGSSLIPELLSSFRMEYSEIKFILAQNNEDTEYDFCFTSTYNNIKPESSELLLDEEICLAVPHTHPLAEKESIELEEMEHDSFISLDEGKQLRILTDTFCNAVGFHPNIVFECDNPALVRSLIEAELGVAFVPRDSWNIGGGDKIKYLHIKRPVCVRSLFITWSEKQYISEQGYLFLNFVKKYFAMKNEKLDLD